MSEIDIVTAGNEIGFASDFLTALYMATSAMDESEDGAALRAVAGAAIDCLGRAKTALGLIEDIEKSNDDRTALHA